MALDLIILGAILLFGLLGAYAGGAQQIAQLAGLVAAYLCARPLGRLLGPRLGGALGTPQVVGVILATVAIFVALLIAVRIIAGALLRRMMAGKDPRDRSLDRSLGLVFGAVKVVAIAYVVLSALAFVEQHVVVAGRRLGISASDSYAFKLAREHNLFEMMQFAPVRDLVALSKAMEDPERAEKLRHNPAYQAVMADPRFKRALASPDVQRAFQSGDYRALLRSNAILQLVQDPTFAARIGAAARSSE